jgi:DNA-binding NtrC family response regulator
LNERKEDIPELVEHFLLQIAEEYGDAKKKIEQDALAEMSHHDWSGNIRELRNVVERLVIMSQKSITASDVKKYLKS